MNSATVMIIKTNSVFVKIKTCFGPESWIRTRDFTDLQSAAIDHSANPGHKLSIIIIYVGKTQIQPLNGYTVRGFCQIQF